MTGTRGREQQGPSKTIGTYQLVVPQYIFLLESFIGSKQVNTSESHVRCTEISCMPLWVSGRGCRSGLHEIWTVSVNDGAERQSVSKGSGHVGDFHIAVARGGSPTPLL